MDGTLSMFDLVEQNMPGDAVSALREELFAMRQNLKTRMDAGLPAEDMGRAMMAAEAIAAAEEVVATVSVSA